jgi:hypothetical protein
MKNTIVILLSVRDSFYRFELFVKCVQKVEKKENSIVCTTFFSLTADAYRIIQETLREG